MTTPPTENNTAPSVWHERIDATRESLRDPASAIRFALEHVYPPMFRDFMEDWQDDHDAGESHRVRHFLEGMKEDLRCGQPEALAAE